MLLAVPFALKSQNKKTTFGIQYKPILVSNIGGAGSFTVQSGNYKVDVMPQTGHAYGMLIRTDLSKNITVETGINKVERRYEYAFLDMTTNAMRNVDFGFVNYEIPIKGLIYIQLSENMYMDGALGTSLDIYVSDVTSADDSDFRQETFRGQWLKFALEASLGAEYRTKNLGYFYLGGTFHSPFGEVARSRIQYEPTTGQLDNFNFGLNSGYLTVDLRYFFHEEPNK